MTIERTPLTAGTTVKILKGCAARDVAKNTTAKVAIVQSLGADFGHQVRVQLALSNGKFISFYARHVNRLSDVVINLNDGNPLHKIQIVRKV